MNSKQNLEFTIGLEIRRLESLPPISPQTREILTVLNDPEVSLDKLSAVLEQSPALTAKIIGVANSAYFGYNGKVHTLQQAIINVIGLTLVKSLGLGLIIGHSLNTKDCPAFSSTRFWFAAISSAYLAQQLNDRQLPRSRHEPGVVYTAALLARLGILAMVHLHPELMNEVFRGTAQSDQPVSAILLDRYEIDQHQVGQWLAMKWLLPPIYQTAIRHHSNPNYQGPDAELIQLVGLSTRLADTLHLPHKITAEDKDRLAGLGHNAQDFEKLIDAVKKKLDEFHTIVNFFSKT